MNDIVRLDIKYLKGVGPKRAELLAKELNIHSYYDMLYYFPFRYIDKSQIHRICDLKGSSALAERTKTKRKNANENLL